MNSIEDKQIDWCDDHLMPSTKPLDWIETRVRHATNNQNWTNVREGLNFNANNDMAFDFDSLFSLFITIKNYFFHVLRQTLQS